MTVPVPATIALPPREISLNELLRILWRQRYLMAATVGAILLITAVMLQRTTPLYTATAKVTVDTRQANVVDLEQVFSGLPMNAETMQSEIEAITSTTLAARVVDFAGLMQQPEFNSALGSGGWFSRQKDAATTEETAKARRKVMDRYRKALEVRIAGRSRVIDISFTSASPTLAAEVANATAELYLTSQLDAKFDATNRARDWLNRRLSQLSAEAEAAELSVARFRALNNLGGNAPARNLSIEVAEAGRNLDIVTARLAALQALRTSQTADDVDKTSSATLKGLYRNVTELTAERDALAIDLGPRHPRMIDLSGRIVAAQQAFAAELDRTIADTQAEVRSAEQRRSILSAQQSQVETIADAGEAQARLRTLERQAQASRELYETFLARAKQTTEQTGLMESGLLKADAKFTSPAMIPDRPSFPNTRMFLLLALMGAVGAAIILAFLAEQLDSGFRSSDQIEENLGLPTIAVIPSLSSLGVKNTTPEAHLKDKPTSAYAEAVRMLRTNLILTDVASPPRVVMLTSALAGEGKTTMALALARLATMSGEKVVVVDADIRRPRIHTALNVENKGGLVEVISGQLGLEQAIHSTEPEGRGIHFMTAGKHTPQATELVRSQQMAAIIARLKNMYTLVIIDSPPVLPVADARMIANLVERVIYVVRWNEARREVVGHAVKQLRDAGAQFAGVVLNAVNVRRHAEYGYSDSGYYYGKQRKYYTE